MPEKPEDIPPNPIPSCVREQVVSELVKEAGREVGYPIHARVLIYCNGAVAGKLPDIGPEGDPVNVVDVGEIRMRFRRTGSTTRFLFFIEALFPWDSRAPNFSGFSARGSAKINPDGSCSARYDTWVVKLCDDSWSLWI